MARYEHLLFGIKTIHSELTDGVAETVYQRHNFKFCVGLEIDLEVGSNLRDTQVWDGQASELSRIISEALWFQKIILKYKIDPDEIIKHVWTKQLEDAPEYLQYQVEKIGVPDYEAISEEAKIKVEKSLYI
jgi:hypothetical protein